MSFFVMLHDFARIGAKWEQMGKPDTQNSLTELMRLPESRARDAD